MQSSFICAKDLDQVLCLTWCEGQVGFDILVNLEFLQRSFYLPEYRTSYAKKARISNTFVLYTPQLLTINSELDEHLVYLFCPNTVQ